MAARVVIPDASFPPVLTVPHTKPALRSLLRQQRKALGEPQRQQQQDAVKAQLQQRLQQHRPARTALYLAAGSELDLHSEDPQWQRWTEICVPVLGDTTLGFCPPRPPWINTPVGTREPQCANPLPAQAMDVIVLPLLACDAQGARLGQGGGWYDRTLGQPASALPLLVGVGFDLQLVERVPTEAHDRPLDIFFSARHARAFTERGKQWLTGS